MISAESSSGGLTTRAGEKGVGLGVFLAAVWAVRGVPPAEAEPGGGADCAGASAKLVYKDLFLPVAAATGGTAEFAVPPVVGAVPALPVPADGCTRAVQRDGYVALW